MRKTGSPKRSPKAAQSGCYYVHWQTWPNMISYSRQPKTEFKCFKERGQAEAFMRELRTSAAARQAQCLARIEVVT